MWNKSIFLSLAIVFAWGGTAAATIVSGPLTGEVRWTGEITISGVVTVTPAATLTIAAGSRIRPENGEAHLGVQGTLKALGTARAPVVFEKIGVELVETVSGNLFEYVRFDGAPIAIGALASTFAVRHGTFVDCGTAVKLYRESLPLIEDTLFEKNEIGVDNDMKSNATVRRCRFVGQKVSAINASHSSLGPIEGNVFEKNRQGIVLTQKYADRISGNRFVENEVALSCNQTQATPAISGNTFEKNGIAIANVSFAYPLIEDNRFLANRTAVQNDQYGSPRITHNLFRANATAIHNNRKSNPVIEKNTIEGGERAIFCDYSSYPTVKENNISGARLGVELGIFQSADWERRSGSVAIIREQSEARKSQNPLLAKVPTEFNDFVEVSGNWWGDATVQLRAGGNAPLFFDRKDKEFVTYDGFGPDSYRLDEVRFVPWLEVPVRDAGPKRMP
jgi:parallel beta-helix repeat protein